MKITFVSNYINHHQLPFSRAMCKKSGVEYTFIQTEPMEEERIRMGWQVQEGLDFLKLYYQEPESCQRLIEESDLVIFGGCEEESYIQGRLSRGKPVIRYTERIYKEGQWKAVSPRGLLKKYKDHVRYRKSPVYLLCSGAYVSADFKLIGAYPGKMYKWGYFPETKTYDLQKLFAGKGYGEEKTITILWAARMIDWKHPELVVETAHYLKNQGIRFRMIMAGGGELEEKIRGMAEELQVTDCMEFPGFLEPDKVRSLMEQADIYLVTSDRGEGWGAVVNEAMNSGCAVVADHMIGAVPYLIRHGENGMIYRDRNKKQLFSQVASLAKDRSLCRQLGQAAYETVTQEWNAENAADCLMELIGRLGICQTAKVCKKEEGRAEAKEITPTGPCSPALKVSEQKMYRYLMRKAK